jgi:hypothetical protein
LGHSRDDSTGKVNKTKDSGYGTSCSITWVFINAPWVVAMPLPSFGLRHPEGQDYGILTKWTKR